MTKKVNLAEEGKAYLDDYGFWMILAVFGVLEGEKDAILNFDIPERIGIWKAYAVVVSDEGSSQINIGFSSGIDLQEGVENSKGKGKG